MRKFCCSKFHPAGEDRFLGLVEPLDNDIQTDGFCESCYLKEMEAVDEYIRTHPKHSPNERRT